MLSYKIIFQQRLNMSSAPRRWGLSKRTRERKLEDVTRMTKKRALDLNTSNNIKTITKPNIEILSVQILQPATECYDNSNPVESNNVTGEDNLLMENSSGLFIENKENAICNLVSKISNTKVLKAESSPVECSEENINKCNANESITSIDQKIIPFDIKTNYENEKGFINDLKSWSLRYNVTAVSLSSLLLLLISYGFTFLPQDSRTLKCTPRHTTTRDVAPGSYWHFGIKQFLSVLHKLKIDLPKTLTLNINIDGLPLFNSSKGAFWPILGKFSELPKMQPFVIGLLYHDSSKPFDAKVFLKDLIEEVRQLALSPFMNNFIKIGIFIFDAVASAFIRGVVPHNAYKACPKCTTTGSHHGRMCYASLDSIPRTNFSFRSRNDQQHHQEKCKEPNSSAIEAFDIDVIKSCPNDYMHLILLGVTKKFLKMILKKNEVS